MSEVRARSLEDPMPEGRRPRGVTPHLRSGAAAKSTRLRRHRNCREELSCVRGQAGEAERRYPASKVRGSDKRSYPVSEVRVGGREEIPHAPKPKARGGGREEPPHTPKPEARGGSREEQPHVQGAVATRSQEGLEELSHVEGQEGRQ